MWALRSSLFHFGQMSSTYAPLCGDPSISDIKSVRWESCWGDGGLEFIALECHSPFSCAMLTLLGMRLLGALRPFPNPHLMIRELEITPSFCPADYQRPDLEKFRRLCRHPVDPLSHDPKPLAGYGFVASHWIRPSSDHTNNNMDAPLSHNQQDLTTGVKPVWPV